MAGRGRRTPSPGIVTSVPNSRDILNLRRWPTSPPEVPRSVPTASQRIDNHGQGRNCPGPRRGQQLPLRVSRLLADRLLCLSLLRGVGARRRVSLRTTLRPQGHRAPLYTSLHFIKSLLHHVVHQEGRKNSRKHCLDRDNVRAVGRASPRTQPGGRSEDCRARKRDARPATRRSTGAFTEFCAFLAVHSNALSRCSAVLHCILSRAQNNSPRALSPLASDAITCTDYPYSCIHMLLILRSFDLSRNVPLLRCGSGCLHCLLIRVLFSASRVAVCYFVNHVARISNQSDSLSRTSDRGQVITVETTI